jgi:hypothetical protein
MKLRATGGALRGTYQQCAGKIDGVAAGNKLTGTWSEDGSRCPDDIETSGTFTWTLEPSGKAFTGTWSFKDPSKNPSHRIWTGTRTPLTPLG